MHRGKAGLIGGGIALALVGIAVGTLLPKTIPSPPSPKPVAVARAMTIIPMEARPATSQTQDEFEIASAPMPTLPAAPPVEQPSLAPRPVTTSSARPLAPRSAAPTPAASRQASATQPFAGPGQRGVERPAALREPPPPPVEVVESAPVFVERGVARARGPSRAEVMAADRNLRRAWAEAAQAGAGRDLLMDYRRRWERLNRESSLDTNHLVRSYRQMADELDNATFFSDDAVG
jgi:hypothetical protein